MSSPAGTIDLGELPHGEPPELDPPWPARRRLAGWRGALRWRPWAAAAMTGLVLATITAAAGRPQPALVLQFVVQAADHNVVFDDQHAYVFERQATAGEMVVIAHRWDGTIHWRTGLPGTDYGWLAIWGGAVLVTTVPTGQVSPWPVEQTVRLDPDSGEPLWTADGSPVGATEDLIILARRVLDGGRYEDDGAMVQPPTELAAVDPATGRTMWSVQAEQWAYSLPQSPNLVVLAADGGLVSYDLGTGGLLATAPAAQPLGTERPSYRTLQTFGSHALLIDEADGRWAISAYDAATVQLLWTLTGDASGEYGSSAWPFSCGELVCLSVPRQPLRAVKPDTGELVWTAGWAAADAGDSWYDIQYPGASRYALLTRTAMRIDDQTSWLIEIDTGRPILELGDWTAAGFYGIGPGSDTSIMTHGGEEGMWIGRLRPDLSGIEVLGRIGTITADDEQSGHCVSHAAHLVCTVTAMAGEDWSHVEVEVWRLPG